MALKLGWGYFAVLLVHADMLTCAYWHPWVLVPSAGTHSAHCSIEGLPHATSVTISDKLSSWRAMTTCQRLRPMAVHSDVP